MGWVRNLRGGAMGVAAMLLAACQATNTSLLLGAAEQGERVKVDRLKLEVPDAWGGEVRCSAAAGCRLVVVEHETSMLVLVQLGPGRSARVLDKQKLAYHPDGAAWLADDLVVAAVEASQSLDVYRVEGGRLRRVEQIAVGIPPRDVMVASVEQGRYRLLATPYSGKTVVWVDYTPEKPAFTRIYRREWCEAPWHPERVPRAPGAPAGGVAVACLDDQKVAFVGDDDLLDKPRTLAHVPGARRIVSRQAKVSPSGRWLYVALETGERNVRVDMDTGELQWLRLPRIGAVSVVALKDDMVVWGDDLDLYFQRFDPQGEVLETRWLPVGGFATELQLQDVDGDGEEDLVVLHSGSLPEKKTGVEVIYGPLWERAEVR